MSVYFKPRLKQVRNDNPTEYPSLDQKNEVKRKKGTPDVESRLGQKISGSGVRKPNLTTLRRGVYIRRTRMTHPSKSGGRGLR